MVGSREIRALSNGEVPSIQVDPILAVRDTWFLVPSCLSMPWQGDFQCVIVWERDEVYLAVSYLAGLSACVCNPVSPSLITVRILATTGTS